MLFSVHCFIILLLFCFFFFFFFQAEDGIRDIGVTGVQTCALPILAMARMLGWEKVAPFYIDLEAPVPESSIPKPGPLTVHLKDDHLQYAITWFGLACAVAIAFGVWLFGQRSVRKTTS